MNKSFFGVIGLGVMGRSISLNIADKGYSIAVYNRAEGNEAHVVQDFLTAHDSYTDLKGFTDLPAFVQSLETPRKILMMIKAGVVVDTVIDQLIPLLEDGDIIIDGGNSHFKDTARRSKLLLENTIHYVGCGVSGGEAGARKGPSIMPGGSRSGYAIVAPVLDAIAAKDRNGAPCCAYIGPDGAGHFVKMIHNGIEYAEMQLLAELYAILSQTLSYEEIAALFDAWNKSDVSGYLLEITAAILRKKEGEGYLLDVILDRAENKGTGSWSGKAAFDLGASATMMVSAVFARYVSSYKAQREVLSAMLHTNTASAGNIDLEMLQNAYRFARMINHHQGFEVMRRASEQYNWGLSCSEIARIWTNGCIIRSALMEESSLRFKAKDQLLDHEDTIGFLDQNETVLSAILKYGLDNRIALPAFSAAHSYWISMTTAQLPANMIQAQRDYFGAHTYQRTDAPEDQFFHTNWDAL